MTEKLTLRDNAAVRWAALLLLALAMFCSYIFMDILSPIKDLMQSERGCIYWHLEQCRVLNILECIRILFNFCRYHS